MAEVPRSRFTCPASAYQARRPLGFSFLQCGSFGKLVQDVKASSLRLCLRVDITLGLRNDRRSFYNYTMLLLDSNACILRKLATSRDDGL